MNIQDVDPYVHLAAYLVASLLPVLTVFWGRTPYRLPVIQYVALCVIAVILALGYGFFAFYLFFEFVPFGRRISIGNEVPVGFVAILVGGVFSALVLRPLRS